MKKGKTVNEITEETLSALREQVGKLLSPKRFYHTCKVEEMVAALSALYCPEMGMKLRAAALLHDITKEKSTWEQAELCRTYGLPVTPADFAAPKTFHARTAAAQIPVTFPEYNDPLIVSAVRWHTTGHAGMTLPEKLLYLADYIDDSRTYRNCVLLRRFFFGAEPEKLSSEERAELLRQTLLLSYDFTIRDLLEEGTPIAEDTVRARNELIPAEAAAKKGN